MFKSIGTKKSGTRYLKVWLLADAFTLHHFPILHLNIRKKRLAIFYFPVVARKCSELGFVPF